MGRQQILNISRYKTATQSKDQSQLKMHNPVQSLQGFQVGNCRAQKQLWDHGDGCDYKVVSVRQGTCSKCRATKGKAWSGDMVRRAQCLGSETGQSLWKEGLALVFLRKGKRRSHLEISILGESYRSPNWDKFMSSLLKERQQVHVQGRKERGKQKIREQPVIYRRRELVSRSHGRCLRLSLTLAFTADELRQNPTNPTDLYNFVQHNKR